MTPVKAEFDDLSLQEAKDDTGKPAKRDSQKLAEVQLEVPGGEPKKDKEAKKEARRSKEGTSVSVGNLTQSDPPKPTIDIQEASSSQKKPETKLPEVVYYFVLLSFDSLLSVFCLCSLLSPSVAHQGASRLPVAKALVKDHEEGFTS